MFEKTTAKLAIMVANADACFNFDNSLRVARKRHAYTNDP